MSVGVMASAVHIAAGGGAAPTVVSSAFGGGGSEAYFTKPASGASGDWYLFPYNAQDSGTSPPSDLTVTGFTATPTTPIGGANSHSMFFYKAWSSGDPAYIELLNRAGHWNYMNSLILRGWSGSAPVLGTPAYQTSGSTHVTTGMTGLPANSLAVLYLSDYDGSSGITNGDGTWTLVHRGQFNAAVVWTKPMTAGGNTGSPTLTGVSTVGRSMSLMCYVTA